MQRRRVAFCLLVPQARAVSAALLRRKKRFPFIDMEVEKEAEVLTGGPFPL